MQDCTLRAALLLPHSCFFFNVHSAGQSKRRRAASTHLLAMQVRMRAVRHRQPVVHLQHDTPRISKESTRGSLADGVIGSKKKGHCPPKTHLFKSGQGGGWRATQEQVALSAGPAAQETTRWLVFPNACPPASPTAWATARPPDSNPRPESRVLASTTRSRAGVTTLACSKLQASRAEQSTSHSMSRACGQHEHSMSTQPA